MKKPWKPIISTCFGELFWSLKHKTERLKISYRWSTSVAQPPLEKLWMESRQLSIKLFFSSILTCFKFRFLPVITLSCKRSCFMSLHRAPGENNNNKNYKKTKPCYFNYFHSSFCLRRGREGKNNLLQVK